MLLSHDRYTAPQHAGRSVAIPPATINGEGKQNKDRQKAVSNIYDVDES